MLLRIDALCESTGEGCCEKRLNGDHILAAAVLLPKPTQQKQVNASESTTTRTTGTLKPGKREEDEHEDNPKGKDNFVDK